MEKSNEKSIIFRQEGNEFYKKREFLSALLKYNQSLCYAEKNSENLAHAYANRSAVYFEMKLYEKCLSNINYAISNNYPQENLEILNKRSEKCKDQVNKIYENYFKLSHQANKRIPFIASSLQLNHDTKYGKHVITNKNLSVGDVIAIEKPFCCVPIIESRFVKIPELNNYQRCNNCLRDNQLDLTPCSFCCQVMFCSTDCQNHAMRFYHKYECPIISELLKSGSINMALRIFFIGLSIFDNDIEKFKKCVNENRNASKTIFDYNFSSVENEDYLKNYFLSLICLSRSTKKFSLTPYENILSTHPLLQAVFNENREFILDFIQRQCQISDHNFHGIFSSSLSASDTLSDMRNLQMSIGSGSLPFASLINHSCSPNVMRICEDGKVVFIVCRPIQKGSQIFDCYKDNFLMESKESRQLKLFNEFAFKCECEACEKNWPTFKALTMKDAKLMKIAKKLNEEMQIIINNRNQTSKKVQICKEILQKNFENYPSMELCIIQKIFAALCLKLAECKVLF
ncbi:hypothetical protein PVAND_005757 [Polypedilum vanderplanki]|uniref:Uncharacterized protein n=1 Tax=Polypedilum vanderplanki TaxID=319348 RepID=A0A9J6C121_POLVA|nr:hypothetical protein PVAND_005757 [Polypedilum vanderplanki]